MSWLKIYYAFIVLERIPSRGRRGNKEEEIYYEEVPNTP